jgi:hypothetical protein
LKLHFDRLLECHTALPEQTTKKGNSGFTGTAANWGFSIEFSPVILC